MDTRWAPPPSWTVRPCIGPDDTVALDNTLRSIAGLGVLVLIRTFLSWPLMLEVGGRWPWQARPEVAAPRGADSGVESEAQGARRRG